MYYPISTITQNQSEKARQRGAFFRVKKYLCHFKKYNKKTIEQIYDFSFLWINPKLSTSYPQVIHKVIHKQNQVKSRL